MKEKFQTNIDQSRVVNISASKTNSFCMKYFQLPPNQVPEAYQLHLGGLSLPEIELNMNTSSTFKTQFNLHTQAPASKKSILAHTCLHPKLIYLWRDYFHYCKSCCYFRWIINCILFCQNYLSSSNNDKVNLVMTHFKYSTYNNHKKSCLGWYPDNLPGLLQRSFL